MSPVGARFWTVRWLAAVSSVAGVALTVSALSLVSFQGNPPANAQTPSFGEFSRTPAIALWAVVAGYTLILAGSFVPHPDRWRVAHADGDTDVSASERANNE